MFIQQLINGLSVGSVYALMAVGYALIYSLLNFTNFAHSITVTIGAFSVFFFLVYGVQNLYPAESLMSVYEKSMNYLPEVSEKSTKSLRHTLKSHLDSFCLNDIIHSASAPLSHESPYGEAEEDNSSSLLFIKGAAAYIQRIQDVILRIVKRIHVTDGQDVYKFRPVFRE